MYCPNCSANNTNEHKFCRSCGLNLERITESLVDQLQNADGVSASKISRFFETLGKIGFGGIIGAGLVGVFFLILTIVNKFILSGQIDKIIIGIVFVVLFISAILGLVFVVFEEYKKERLKQKVKTSLHEFEKKDTAKLLNDSTFEPIMSVTENSTNQLVVKLKTKSSSELK